METQKSDVEIIESGHIFFLFRPKVDRHEVGGPDDVQRFYIALRPHGHQVYRLMVVGDKKLPRADRHDRYWGFVDTVTGDARALEEGMREQHYETKTRGEQVNPAMRPAGEGVYVIAIKGNSSHLAYHLEFPEKPGPVQQALNIAPELLLVFQVKNPEKGSPYASGLDEERKPDLPKHLMDRFRDRRFSEIKPADFLDHEGVEFILVGAARDVCADLGIDLDEEASNAHADIQRVLHVVRSRHPLEPLFRGQWA